MNELELIRRLIPTLSTHPAVVTGAGDDCAVLDLGLPGHFLLLKTDAVVESVHFTKETPPEKIGRKALARCLSDVGAMAGRPVAALITLGLPADFESAFVDRLYQGLNGLASEYQVAIAGGETTLNPQGVFVSISILGTVPKARCLLRSGAKAGDAIFVTGQLGGSLAGRHLDFEPRLREAEWLADNFPIHAMIDISDGLAADLHHLADASELGAELLSSAIPISRAARAAARAEGTGKTPLLAALTDGEDFELLFTVHSVHAVGLLDAWNRQFPGLRLSCIGKMKTDPGIIMIGPNGTMTLPRGGYVHFGRAKA